MPVELDTTPFWIDSAKPPTFPRLEHDTRADVVVVGGGITGLTAAYLLAVSGRSVALLERRKIADVDTGHTTAHLTMVTDLAITDLVNSFGPNHAQAVWDAGFAAIAQVDEIIRQENIDCDFAWVPGYLHPVVDLARESDVNWLQEQATLAEELGFDVAFVDDVPLAHTPGVMFADQARFHPIKYLSGLAKAILAHGGHIYEHSEAKCFSDDPRVVEANGRKITCDHIVIATHTPLVGTRSFTKATLFQTKLALYTSYVVGGKVAKGKVPDALLWDIGDPYHYLRIEPQTDHDLVIYGGEDHKTGQVEDTTQGFESLERTLRALVPGVEITHRWSGQVIETPDGLPYIGETADHEFSATGFSGNGMTFGTLAGIMAADYVQDRRNPWSELFKPGRTKILHAAWDYIRENKDYPYYLIRDRFAGPEGRSLRAVKRGEGKIIEYQGQQAAVYRDKSGHVTVRSAICTHMGCLVDWNSAERTWDCPCHGSRFKTNGAVLAGPAESPLEKLK
jgi:glycine/D-amino acid oxidase-like deaminating enzyme/nitrite reductase/ring-hydroxylating ferredoxin subunit